MKFRATKNKKRTTLPSSPFRGISKIDLWKEKWKTNYYSILSIDMIRYSHVSRPYICLHSSRDLTLHSCLRNFPSLQYSSRYSNTMCTIFFIFVFIIYTTIIVPNLYDWQEKMIKLYLHLPTGMNWWSLWLSFLFYKTRKCRSLRTVSDFGLEATIWTKVSYFTKRETISR